MDRLSSILLILLLFVSFCGYTQYSVTFDDSSSAPYFSIDTNSLWVVAPPQKTRFNAAYSTPNVIITDSMSGYPINDTSVFYLYHTVNFFDLKWPLLDFRFQIDADSMKDYGTLEASYDLGQTWFDVISAQGWWIPETGQPGSGFPFVDSIPFTGTSSQWYHFTAIMSSTSSDTIIFRFSFITDSINTNQEGWMIDDIVMSQTIQNLPKYSSSSLRALAYPNPASSMLHIQLLNGESEAFTCHITDVHGKVILSLPDVRNNEITIPIQGISPGLYFWHIYGNTSGRTAIDRFVIAQ